MWNGTPMRVASLLPSLMLAACMLTGEETAPEGASVAAAAPAARSSGEPGEVRPGPLTQARADCWMKVETQKGLRSIDQRSAFVDKCVAEQLKSKPSP